MNFIPPSIIGKTNASCRLILAEGNDQDFSNIYICENDTSSLKLRGPRMNLVFAFQLHSGNDSYKGLRRWTKTINILGMGSLKLGGMLACLG